MITVSTEVTAFQPAHAHLQSSASALIISFLQHDVEIIWCEADMAALLLGKYIHPGNPVCVYCRSFVQRIAVAVHYNKSYGVAQYTLASDPCYNTSSHSPYRCIPPSIAYCQPDYASERTAKLHHQLDEHWKQHTHRARMQIFRNLFSNSIAISLAYSLKSNNPPESLCYMPARNRRNPSMSNFSNEHQRPPRASESALCLCCDGVRNLPPLIDMADQCQI